jgi:thymidylate synthase ThyX
MPPTVPALIGYGVATLEIEVPLYIWTEILTHRRFSRNASSARAMSTKRYAEMGYYLPPTWYEQGAGMTSGKALTKPAYMRICEEEYTATMQAAIHAAQKLQYLAPDVSLAKEQSNRLIPPIKMIRGIVTGTEAAWNAFRRLRLQPSADVAMERLARMIYEELMGVNWRVDTHHAPYADDHAEEETQVARIARVSYNRESGKNDLALYQALLADQHLSPFEHTVEWVRQPPLSNVASRPTDVLFITDKEMVLPKETQRHLQHNPYWYHRSFYGWKQRRGDVERIEETSVYGKDAV